MVDYSAALPQLQQYQVPNMLAMASQANQMQLYQAQLAKAQNDAEMQSKLRSLNRNSPEFVNQLYAMDPAKGLAYDKGLLDFAEAKRKRGEAASDRAVTAKKEAELEKIYGGFNNLTPAASAAPANTLVAPAEPAMPQMGFGANVGGYTPTAASAAPAASPTVAAPSPNMPDYASVISNLVKGGHIDEAKKIAELAKTSAEGQGKATEASVAKFRAAYEPIQSLLPHVQTPADVEAYTRRLYADPMLSAEASKLKPVDQAVQDNLDLVNKVGIDQWRARNSGMDAKQLHDLVTSATAPSYEKVDKGGSIAFLDKNPKSDTFGQYLHETQKTMTPAQGAKEMPPTVSLQKGEVWNKEAGRVDVVPGTAAFITRSQSHAEDVTALNGLKEKSDEAIANIKKMLSDENKEGFQANFGGAGTTLQSRMPGKAADFKGMLNTFKSNMKSAGLEMMRAGGSIGAMTEKEWPIVEAEMASLDGWMTEENARNVMRNVIARLDRIKKSSEKVYDMTWGETQFHPKNKNAPSESTTPDRPPLTFFGGK
jgi:hypothetical protein